MSGTRTGVPRRARRGPRWWLALTVEIATIVGVLVAAAALLLDHPLFGGSGAAAPPNPSTGVRSPNTVTSSAPVGSSAQPSTPTRYLTDLEPDSGGGFVQRVGSHSLRMVCGSGDSDDRQREVSYVVPPALTYRSFASGISAAGLQDTRIRAVLLIDQHEVEGPIVTTGSTARLTWSGERAGQVTLRIICDPGATAATFVDPGLSG